MSTIVDIFKEIAAKIPVAYQKGKQDEHEAFWDVFHYSSTYVARFAGSGWRVENFRPTQDIIIGELYNANHCFYYNAANVDLVEWCEQLGINISLKPYSVLSMFQGSKFTRIPEVDVTNTAALSSTFAYCDQLVTIDKLVLKEDGTNTFSSTFYDCKALENITIEGVIGKDVQIQWSKKLTKASLQSIMNARSATATFSISVSKVAVNKAFETSVGANDGSTSAEWLALVNEKPNCTVSVVNN